MISFQNVSLSFPETTVFENFNAEFEENKINCILGPSGSGKTTFLNLLSGSIAEDSGHITKPQRVSYVFQDDALIPQQTARRNLELILKSVYKEKAALKTVIDDFLELTGIKHAEDLYPHEMSGGMRQRLALIRAFAYPSEVLLMDEPFKALDITLRDNILKAFINLYKKDQRTVFFVTHDIDEALMAGDNIYVYSNKPLKLQKKFTIDEEKSGRKIYGEDITRIKNEIHMETEKWQF